MEAPTTEVITKDGWIPIRELAEHDVLFITDDTVSFRKAEAVEKDMDKWIYDRTSFGKKKFNYEFTTCKKTVQYKLFMRLIAWLLYDGEIATHQPPHASQYECIWLRFKSDRDVELLDQLNILYTLRIAHDPNFDHVEITHDIWLEELRNVCYDMNGKKVPDFVLLEGYNSDELLRRPSADLSRRLASQLQWASLFSVDESWLIMEAHGCKYRVVRDAMPPSRESIKRVEDKGVCVVRHCFDGTYFMRLS